MKSVALQPFKAEWQEMSLEDFQKSYADARLEAQQIVGAIHFFRQLPLASAKVPPYIARSF
jgi:hypothetical protein